jgi:hypothetical protein
MDSRKPDDIRAQEIWKKGLLLLVFMVAFGVAQALLNLIAVVQFLWLLFAKEANQFLLRFGKSLSIWFAEAARFLTCATDDKPFPWKDWPDAG